MIRGWPGGSGDWTQTQTAHTPISPCPYPVSGARAGVSVTLGLRPSTGQSDVMWRPRLPAPLPRLSGPSDQLRDWASRAGRGGREQRLVRVSGGRAGHVEWSVDCWDRNTPTYSQEHTLETLTLIHGDTRRHTNTEDHWPGPTEVRRDERWWAGTKRSLAS